MYWDRSERLFKERVSSVMCFVCSILNQCFKADADTSRVVFQKCERRWLGWARAVLQKLAPAPVWRMYWGRSEKLFKERVSSVMCFVCSISNQCFNSRVRRSVVTAVKGMWPRACQRLGAQESNYYYVFLLVQKQIKANTQLFKSS